MKTMNPTYHNPAAQGGDVALRQLMRYWEAGTEPFITFRDALEYVPNLQPLVNTPYGESPRDMALTGFRRREIVVERFRWAAQRVEKPLFSLWAIMQAQDEINVFVEILGHNPFVELGITLKKGMEPEAYWLQGFTTPVVDLQPRKGWEIYKFDDGTGIYRRPTTLQQAIEDLCPPEEE